MLGALLFLACHKPDTNTAASVARNDVFFDHASCTKGAEATDACLPEYRIRRGNGDLFTVRIVHTDSLAFDYTIAGVLVPHEDKGTPQKGPAVPNDVVDLTQQHDKKFGGYIVRIQPKPGPAGAGTKLGAATIRITVETPQTNIGFGGGFTVSGLVDPPYAVEETTVPATATAPATTSSKLIEQDSRRDASTRGMGSFVHVWHTSAPALALSFGLGLNGNQSANYYAGPSLRLGDKAFLSGGWMWGSVKSPPSGIEVGSTVKDVNVLNNLGSRTARSWFVGLSYTFISGAEDAIKKPFAGQSGEQTPRPAPGTGAGTPATPAKLTCAPITVAADGATPITVVLAPPHQDVNIDWTVPTKTPSGDDNTAGTKVAPATSKTDAGGKATTTGTVTGAGVHLIRATATALTGAPAVDCVITRS